MNFQSNERRKEITKDRKWEGGREGRMEKKETVPNRK